MNGFLSLIFGSVIVAFHNVWTGLPMVLTLIGWAQVIKALASFVMPEWGMRGLQRVSYDRAHEFVVGGLVCLALSALMLYTVKRDDIHAGGPQAMRVMDDGGPRSRARLKHLDSLALVRE